MRKARAAARVTTSTVPAVVCTALVAVILWRAGTPIGDIARFAAYWVVAVVWPGLVAWRCLRGRAGRLVEDVAAGAAVGLAIELFAYMAAASVGRPRWYVVVPVGIAVVGTAVPALRRRWLQRTSAPMQVGAAWLLAAVVVCAVAFVAVGNASGFDTHPLTDGYPLASYPDMPYQLALAAEARHRFPLTTPYVAGEPLHYQYFVHIHMAAASWTSGVDLPMVLYRLVVVPMVVLAAVLTAALARRLCKTGEGRGGGVRKAEWVGPAAALLAVVSTSPISASWNVTSIAYVSPTQAYANVVLGALMLLLVDLLRGESRRPDWVLVAVLLAASTASKGTVLPLVIGSFAVTAVVQAMFRRRWRAPVLGLGLALAAWAVAYVAVFGGESLGLEIQPLHLLGGPDQPDIAFLLLGTAVSWGAPLLGALVVTVKDIRDPGGVFVSAAVAGGAGAALLFGQAAQSEAYFVRTVAIAGAAVAVAAIGGLMGERGRWSVRRLIPAGAVAALAVVVLATRATQVPHDIAGAFAGVPPRVTPAATAVTPGELAAARWVRAHAATDDLIATNRHCRIGVSAGPCDVRTFWLAGTAERRVLVEGWEYTSASRAYAVEHPEGGVPPFPDQALLRANDAAFRQPTRAALNRLHDRYGVRWLFADDLAPADERALDRLVEPSYESADVSVYQLH